LKDDGKDEGRQLGSLVALKQVGWDEEDPTNGNQMEQTDQETCTE